MDCPSERGRNYTPVSYTLLGQDIENLIRYIPNTADGCCLERGFPERINLVFLNTGEAYGLEIFDEPNRLRANGKGAAQ